MHTDYQFEYLQSCEIGSYELFRWEANGNTILRAPTESKVTCDRVVLQSPWIPSIENDIDGKIKALIEKKIEVLLIYSEKDEDCLPLSRLFASRARELGLQC
ncbi:MAG: hypothetical protein R6V86_01635 [Spirochaetia bacterium]